MQDLRGILVSMTLRRTVIGLIGWLVFLTILGLVVLEPDHRGTGLLITLPFGAACYVAGEWLRTRRQHHRKEAAH